MIHRLKQLQMKGFRPFLKDTEAISLDAGIVLVYGPNGSGKTGLMCAIECALTGNVAHLQQYASDYPRCLRNISAGENAKVSLIRFPNVNNEEYTHTVEIADNSLGGKIESIGKSLSAVDIRLFSERCYLSQYRLGRLLELYQAVDSKGQSESHLIRFARELLNLDFLGEPHSRS